MRGILTGFILLLAATTFAQHIEGDVVVDLKTGIFQCRMTVSEAPPLSDYKILLNHGMTIKYFKDGAKRMIPYEGYYDGQMMGEALTYSFVDEQQQPIVLPNTFEVTYTGAFPIYDSSYNLFDFKGFIAINGQTIRATEQSKWYPVIYDQANDQLMDQYTYRLNVRAAHCQTIFVNGSAPVTGERAVLSSNKAVPLFLFAGNYDYLQVGDDYLINANIDSETAETIFANVQDIKRLYAEMMNEKFSDAIYVVNHQAINKRAGEWGFNIYPAFGFANTHFDSLLNEDGKFKEDYYALFGHELAHNYFGSNVMSGELQWFWLESGADYLSFFVLEHFVGSERTNGEWIQYVDRVRNAEEEFNRVPLSKISQPEEIDQVYRYQIGPLILKCFELQFGKEKTLCTLQSLLKKADSQTLGIPTWKQAAIECGVSPQDFEQFSSLFLKSDAFIHNALDRVEKAMDAESAE